MAMSSRTSQLQASWQRLQYRCRRPPPQPPPPATWIPFGGGVRRCIGAGFALMEGAAVLRQVFLAWNVHTEHDDEPRVRNITSVPDLGARIHVTPR